MGDSGNQINASLERLTGVKDTEEAEKRARQNAGAIVGAKFGALPGAAAGAEGDKMIMAAKDASIKAADMAEEAQVKVEEELKKNEEIADNTANVKKERTRQKKLAAKKSGRAGTILTSPLGAPSTEAAPLKTLLGS